MFRRSTALRRSLVPFVALGTLLAGSALLTSSGAVTAPDLRPKAGTSGIGDAYFPLDGNHGIDVRRYSVHDRYDFRRGRLSGWTRLKIRATEDLREFNLDLLLDVSRVTVDGERARFRTPGRHELRVTPDAALDAGETFTVVVRYTGLPDRLKYLGERNWLADRREVVTMNEPHMAPWWFPANDHPLDKAVHDFHITVPRGKRVVTNGLPAGKRVRGDLVTWQWSATDPMVPYLAFFAAGDFAVARGRRDGLPWLVAASERLPGNGEKVALRWLKKSPGVTSWLESELGDYPFESTGGLVTSLSPGFALENQTRPTYPFVGGGTTWLLVHELAHQWFGDSVSVKGWRDIWLNEGFATYMEVRYAETHGGPSGSAWLDRAYGQYASGDSFWRLPIADPGPDRIFDGAVYDRGAMTLQALREVIGDQAFETVLRTWVERRRHGNGSTEDFRALAKEITGRDLGAFFDVWLLATEKPADTAANGLG
ncbi:MAG: M1 family metallopeptidase [Nocardioides sp.]